MRKFSTWVLLVLLVALVAGLATAQEGSTMTVTDMAGRTVTLPQAIHTVVATGQPGALMLYTLCPDKLAAWNSVLVDESLAYIPAPYAGLPVLGSLQGGQKTANPEEVVALGPDVLIYMTTLTKQTAAKADAIQAQMGVPVLVVRFDLLHIGESYRFVGDVLDCAEKADLLAAFCDTLIASVEETAATIAEDDRVTFYYTAGGAGLQTSPAGSNHTELIEFAGGINVVDLPAENNGRLKVDMERILSWQPDVIIASTPAILKPVLQWEQVNAVADAKAYTAPTAPFPWLDAPVSINRMIGLCWAAETLYPDVYDFDLSEYTKEFYNLFYGTDLTDEALNALLP